MTQPTEALSSIHRGQRQTAENALMAILEKPDAAVVGWVPVLEALVKDRNDDSAETIAWAMLDAIQNTADGPGALPACGRILRLFSNNEEFRNRAIELYKTAYGDVTSLDRLVDIAGLAGAKPIRRALQTLDIALAVVPGTFLLHKNDGPVARVVSVDRENWSVRLQTPNGEELFDPVSLGDAYEITDGQDFEVLRQFDPAALSERLQSDPAGIVIGLVRRNDNEMTSDQLELLLTPQYVPSEQWTRWWSKTRAQLKKNPRVRLEGRNPVILRWADSSIALEEECWAQFNPQAEPQEWLGLGQEYIRECKSRGAAVDKCFLTKLSDAVACEASALEPSETVDALAAWLVAGELSRLAGGEFDDSRACALLTAGPGPSRTMCRFQHDVFWGLALGYLKKTDPREYAEELADLLPRAPVQYADDFLELMASTDRSARIQAVFDRILQDPVTCLNGLCWLYRGPARAQELPVPPLITLVNRLLSVLELIESTQTVEDDEVRKIRTQVRRTLSAQGRKRFKECVEQIAPGMADALGTQIKRCPGLTQNLRNDLVSTIRGRFPKLWITERQDIKPWQEESTLYCTQWGLDAKKKELEEILNVKMKENSKAIGQAASHGDLSENSEYKFALEERDLLRARAAEIQKQLASARVIRHDDVNTRHVDIGTRVRMHKVDNAESLTLTFLGPWEANVELLVLNYKAPLCQRLMGLKVGDRAELDFTGGQGLYEIQAIEVGISPVAPSGGSRD